MFPVLHFIKGFFKYLTNPKISNLAIVSSNNQFEKGVVIYRHAKVKYSSIGRHTYIGAHTELAKVDVGRFCSIADHCHIGMSSHTLDKLSTCPIFTLKRNGCQERWIEEDNDTEKMKRIQIGNDVWMGSHVLVKSGVHIGDGAVIGAGAVVVKDIPPYAVAVGVPAKVIKYRFDDETIEKLEELKWWEATDEELRKNIKLFQSNMIDMETLEQTLNRRRGG